MNRTAALRICATIGALVVASLTLAQAPKVVPVKFAAGKSSATIKGQLDGRDAIDYTLNVGAGQVLSVSMKSTNNATYFNILPPASQTAMVMGEMVSNNASRTAPIEGQYRVRVFLVRAAGRRGEGTSFTLTIGVTGKALPALKGGSDALVKGTPFHATAQAQFEHYLYKDLKTCQAGVIRRGRDGTGTLVFSFKGQKRMVLFVKGKLVAWDSTDKATCMNVDGMLVIKVGEDETYKVAEEFLTGG